jgi:hypothetical protein
MSADRPLMASQARAGKVTQGNTLKMLRSRSGSSSFSMIRATRCQVWETSDDAGKSWQVSVDGIYKKKGL